MTPQNYFIKTDNLSNINEIALYVKNDTFSDKLNAEIYELVKSYYDSYDEIEIKQKILSTDDFWSKYSSIDDFIAEREIKTFSDCCETQICEKCQQNLHNATFFAYDSDSILICKCNALTYIDINNEYIISNTSFDITKLKNQIKTSNDNTVFIKDNNNIIKFSKYFNFENKMEITYSIILNKEKEEILSEHALFNYLDEIKQDRIAVLSPYPNSKGLYNILYVVVTDLKNRICYSKAQYDLPKEGEIKGKFLLKNGIQTCPPPYM